MGAPVSERVPGIKQLDNNIGFLDNCFKIREIWVQKRRSLIFIFNAGGFRSSNRNRFDFAGTNESGNTDGKPMDGKPFAEKGR